MPDGRYGIEIDSRLLRLTDKSMELKVTEDDFCDALKGYKLDESLIVLGEISKILFDANFKENELWKKEKTGFIIHKVSGQFVTEFAVEYIVNLFLICGSNNFKSLSLKDKDNILGIFSIYHNCIVHPPFKNNLVSLLIPMYLQQLSSQADIKDVLTRQILIFSKVLNEHSGPNKVDLNQYLIDETGMSIQDYTMLTFILLAAILESPRFNIGKFTEAKEEPLKTILTNEKMEAILKMLSATPAELRAIDQLYNSKLPPENTKSRYNPLWQKPIVKLGDNDFVVPSTSAYKKGALTGLYWFFENRLKTKFRDYFGTLFEEYVGLIIKDTYDAQDIEPGILYGSKKDAREFFDWIVNDKGAYILFETKAYQFPFYVLQTGDLDSVRKEILKKVVGTIRQMYERVQDIQKYSELEKFKGMDLRCVAVFYDIPFISTNTYDEDIKAALNGMDSKYPGIKDFKYTLISVDELENYQYVKSCVTIEEVAERARKTPGAGFTSEISAIYKENNLDPKVARNLLDKKFDEFFSEDMGFPYEETA